jgi:HEAT repeats
MDMPQYNGLEAAESAADPASSARNEDGPVHRTPDHAPRTLAAIVAIASGLALALVVGMVSQAHAGRGRDSFSSNSRPDFAGHELNSQDLAQLDRMKPQAQAETLLEAAVRGEPGTAGEISARAGEWYGHLNLKPQLNVLVTAALNSDDLQVRESALDVQLAAYNLSKTPESVNQLVAESHSANHERRVWALWSLGAMANRGVQRDSATAELLTHLNDADEDSRRWAVEGLALAGTEAAIEPLLTVLHDDPSPAVRERAACGIASSGMFTADQRRIAVPRLIQYAEDEKLDAKTHAWTFLALADITQQHLPNDAVAWRTWYEKTVVSGQ